MIQMTLTEWTERPKGQCDRLLRYLQQGNSITPLESCRELPKPKCIVEDVDVRYVDGYITIGGAVTRPGFSVGDWVKINGVHWQIAGFLFAEIDGILTYPIERYAGSYIRANRVRLVRWE